MKTTLTLRTGMLAATLLTLAAMQTASPALAYQCKANYKQGESLSNSVIQGKAAARAAWTNTVKTAYGLQWSVWTIANNKSVTCEWTGTKHYCIAKAKPCLYVVQ